MSKETEVFIIHKTRKGRPMIMSKSVWDGSKELIKRDGWRLATEAEISAHYTQVLKEAIPGVFDEAEPEKPKRGRKKKAEAEPEAKAEEE